MLRYTEIALSRLEVPGEASICVYLSGCVNSCRNCHYPELRRTDYGDSLVPALGSIIELYRSQASCLCVLGEGGGSSEDRGELARCAAVAHENGLLAALYSGRDIDPETWMRAFDYVKLGSYLSDRGPLTEPTTNQRLLRQSEGGWVDVTRSFWDESSANISKHPQ